MYYLATGGGVEWLRYAVLAEVLFALIYRTQVREAIATVDEPAKELAVLGLALARVEREHFMSEKLRELQHSLSSTDARVSKQIHTLVSRVEMLNQRRNQFFFPLAALLLWATQLAFAIEAWRRRHGSSVPGWFESFGEFEAVCALAGYSFEHPEDPFP